MKYAYLRATILAGLLLSMLPVQAQAPNPVPTPLPVLNVRDFGAVGDGKADDTAAIQKAINAACNYLTGPNRVYFAPGTYLITETLKFPEISNSITLLGAGDATPGDQQPSRLLWGGADGGMMMQTMTVFGLHLSGLCFDGGKKADVCLAVDSKMGRPSDHFTLERVWFTGAKNGMICSYQTHDNCAADMTFIDVVFDKLENGFVTNSHQNVNYVFIRPVLGMIDVGFWFKKGGTATFNLIAGTHIGTGLKVDAGDINNGTFSLDGVKIETVRWKGKRTTILDVKGYCTVVNVTNLNSGTFDIGNDDPPLFKLGPAVALSINSSTILGRNIAELTSYPAPTTPAFSQGGSRPTWLQFNNCTFGYCDPRWDTAVVCDANSGYELRNCRDDRGMMPLFRREPASIAPMIPYKVKAVADKAGQLTVSWAPSAGAEGGYQVERRTAASGWTRVGTAGKDAASFTDTGVTAGTTYYYQIRSVNGNVVSWPSIDHVMATAN